MGRLARVFSALSETEMCMLLEDRIHLEETGHLNGGKSFKWNLYFLKHLFDVLIYRNLNLN